MRNKTLKTAITAQIYAAILSCLSRRPIAKILSGPGNITISFH
ncbi:MAG: hypothetical protein ACI8SC_001678 [Colwellia sp.]